MITAVLVGAVKDIGIDTSIGIVICTSIDIRLGTGISVGRDIQIFSRLLVTRPTGINRPSD